MMHVVVPSRVAGAGVSFSIDSNLARSSALDWPFSTLLSFVVFVVLAASKEGLASLNIFSMFLYITLVLSFTFTHTR